MARNRLVTPFVKWVGGKRQIMSSIATHIPKNIKNYYEPFVGGGAVFFHLQLKSAFINDSNSELINVYTTIRDNHEELLESLRQHRNEEDYFYEVRALDRNGSYVHLNPVQRASRFIFLNKTCFNGLYRVNNSGEFNSPFGRYKNPNIVNEPVIKAVSQYLRASNIVITSNDYSTSLVTADERSFVYLDPPYHPVSETSNFTGYVQGGWDEEDQRRLRLVCDELNERGVKFLLSNSSTEFIRELYQDYRIHTIKANRSVNSDGEKRGEVDELLIKNYE